MYTHAPDDGSLFIEGVLSTKKAGSAICKKMRFFQELPKLLVLLFSAFSSGCVFTSGWQGMTLYLAQVDYSVSLGCYEDTCYARIRQKGEKEMGRTTIKKQEFVSIWNLANSENMFKYKHDFKDDEPVAGPNFCTLFIGKFSDHREKVTSLKLPINDLNRNAQAVIQLITEYNESCLSGCP